MNKTWFLTKYSLSKKVKSKWFVLANVLLCLCIIAVFNISSIIKFFGGDFDSPMKIYIEDSIGAYPILESQIKEVEENYYGKDSNNYEVILYKENLLEEVIEKDSKSVGIKLDMSAGVVKATCISLGFIDSVDYQLLQTAMNNTKMVVAMQSTNIDLEELNKIIGPIEIDRKILDETKKTEDENMMMVMTTVFPLLILPFFMLTLFLVQMVGAEINDEKTTKSMEIIISNVSPKKHLISKLVAGNLFVIFQGALLILYVVLGFIFKNYVTHATLIAGLDGVVTDMLKGVLDSGLISNLWYVIPLTLLLMVVTFITYSILAGILASMTTSPEDFQQVQIPIMVILMIGYYLAIMAPTFKGAVFIRVFSYIPLISAILSPSLLVIGQIGIIDILLSTVLCVLVNAILLHFGMKVYKEGILNYSSGGMWKKIFSSLRR